MLLKTPTTYYYAAALISAALKKNEHYPQTVSHAPPTWDVTTIAIKIVPCQSKLMDGDIPQENVRRLVPNEDFCTLVVSGGVRYVYIGSFRFVCMVYKINACGFVFMTLDK